MSISFNLVHRRVMPFLLIPTRTCQHSRYCRPYDIPLLYQKSGTSLRFNSDHVITLQHSSSYCQALPNGQALTGSDIVHAFNDNIRLLGQVTKLYATDWSYWLVQVHVFHLNRYRYRFLVFDQDTFLGGQRMYLGLNGGISGIPGSLM